jgi:hypothetical protein
MKNFPCRYVDFSSYINIFFQTSGKFEWNFFQAINKKIPLVLKVVHLIDFWGKTHDIHRQEDDDNGRIFYYL